MVDSLTTVIDGVLQVAPVVADSINWTAECYDVLCDIRNYLLVVSGILAGGVVYFFVKFLIESYDIFFF